MILKMDQNGNSIGQMMVNQRVLAVIFCVQTHSLLEVLSFDEITVIYTIYIYIYTHMIIYIYILDIHNIQVP